MYKEIKVKQVYVSDETYRHIEKLPKGSKTLVIDTILNKFLGEVINRARITDLQKDKFPVFLEKMIEEMCNERNSSKSNK